jgi:FkbM family methyltransferase
VENSSDPLGALLSLVPGKERILKAAALLPPGLRSAQSSRMFAALARRTMFSAETVRSNMGIARELVCDMPANQLFALYGKPALYAGERASLELAARFSRECDAFVDIGAHLGYFTFYVTTRAPRALPIYFFEPDPLLYARLEQNVRANRLDHVRGWNRAIGAADGMATFYVNRTDTLSGSLTEQFAAHHEVTPTDVTVERFSTAADRLAFHHACVKVDVEGAEEAFLEGAFHALDRVSYLIVEVLGPAHQGRFVQTLMARSGLFAYYINDYTLEPSIDGSFDYRTPEYNWLFCRHAPSELGRRLAPPFQVGPHQ